MNLFKHNSDSNENIILFGHSFNSAVIAFVIIIVGVFVRIWLHGTVPGGINQDEAFGAYDSYSMLTYGIDSAGYSFPVYFFSWGSGMNVLNSYLMMPLIAIFGLHTWVIRIPEVVVACISLPVFYKLFKKIYNEKAALIAVLILAVCPWHIMISRWSLECNLAPGFLLFALYSFILGKEKPRFYMLSALFYGLSLYCYALLWVIVPIIIILQLLYLIYIKKLKWDVYFTISLIILLLLAAPLICFVLVNMGFIDEIRTPFISVPRLSEIRSNEFTFAMISENIKNLYNIISSQNDGLYWNATWEYGLYYKGTLSLAVIGFFYCLKDAIISLRNKSFSGSVILLIQFIAAVLLGASTGVNINRINSIHISIIAFYAVGIFNAVRILKNDFKYAGHAIIIFFSILFLFFSNFYFTTYREGIGQIFQEGIGDSVNYAMELADDNETIYVSKEFSYAKILFFSKMPAPDYIDTVIYANYPSAYLDIVSCGQFYFGINEIKQEGIYIINANSADEFRNNGYTVDIFGYTAVAFK